MVIADSAWVRPAQALIYSESGEVKCFPPRNRGGLPRALTFGDHQDWRQHESNNYGLNECIDPQPLCPFQIPELLQEEEAEFMIASALGNVCLPPLQNPPDEYTSFESECCDHTIHKDGQSYSCMDIEGQSTSTPTEQYINNMLQRKKLLSQASILQVEQKPWLSSASDDGSGCISPLLQPASGPNLSLDELVDLYTKKLEDARAARTKKIDTGNSTARTNEKLGERINDEMVTGFKRENNLNEQNKSSCCESQNGIVANACNPLQLMTVDIQLFLHKLDDIYRGQHRDAHYDDWLYIPTEALESMLMNCCKETIEFVMME